MGDVSSGDITNATTKDEVQGCGYSTTKDKVQGCCYSTIKDEVYGYSITKDLVILVQRMWFKDVVMQL